MPLAGKIDCHFSSADTGAKGWELDAKKLLELLEEATSGTLNFSGILHWATNPLIQQKPEYLDLLQHA